MGLCGQTFSTRLCTATERAVVENLDGKKKQTVCALTLHWFPAYLRILSLLAICFSVDVP